MLVLVLHPARRAGAEAIEAAVSESFRNLRRFIVIKAFRGKKDIFKKCG
jgi:hypothetical protein